MKILVTGARGQLGGELVRRLGLAAIPVDQDEIDFTGGPSIVGAIQRLSPKVVINCAAYTQVDRAEQEPGLCRRVNVDAVTHLVRACEALDCPLLQVSTDYVFAGCSIGNRPLREDDPPAPRGVYACTKHEGEQAAMRLAKHWIVRTCGLYARPSDTQAKNFVRTMLRLGASGGTIRVVADQHCAPSYVPHVAQAILAICGAAVAGIQGLSRPAPWGIYHVVNQGQTTWFDFAAEIFRQAGMLVAPEAITTAQYAAAAPRPAYSVLDTTKYHALGGPIMPNWKAALAEYFDEQRQIRAS